MSRTCYYNIIVGVVSRYSQGRNFNPKANDVWISFFWNDTVFNDAQWPFIHAMPEITGINYQTNIVYNIIRKLSSADNVKNGNTIINLYLQPPVLSFLPLDSTENHLCVYPQSIVSFRFSPSIVRPLVEQRWLFEVHTVPRSSAQCRWTLRSLSWNDDPPLGKQLGILTSRWSAPNFPVASVRSTPGWWRPAPWEKPALHRTVRHFPLEKKTRRKKNKGYKTCGMKQRRL